MAFNGKIRIELLSDLCPASGEGFAGVVDIDVNYDSHGLPYIPGKRLKGCLRECGLDIVSVYEDEYADIFYSIFGKTGESAPSSINIGNGFLEGYEEKIEKIKNSHRSEIAEAYTSTRTRTRMENGKAAHNSLRTIRTLNKGQVYEFSVSLAHEDEKTLSFLKKCVMTLRSMGINRSRGLGEVKCDLVPVVMESGQANVPSNMSVTTGQRFEPVIFGNKYAISYAIELKEPVIAAHRSGKPHGCENYIFGSMVLGAFASAYIQKNYSKGENSYTRENAYTDESFRRIFLEGEVVFSAALPWDGSNIYYPAPSTLKTDKQETRFCDDSAGIQDDEDENNPICRQLGGFVSINGNVIKKHNPTKTTFMHHARPADKAKGQATEKDGQLFTYEALESGQVFSGFVIGNRRNIRKLAGLFSENNTIKLGRSRTAQYGRAVLTKGNNIRKNSFEIRNQYVFRLVVVTPLILENEMGVNTTDLRELGKELCKLTDGKLEMLRKCKETGRSIGNLEIIRYSCSESFVAGYNSKWLLPRGQERAINEGSVVVFKYTGQTATIDIDFIGKRTGEGFGQVRFEKLPENPTGFVSTSEMTEHVGANHTPLDETIAKMQKAKEITARGTDYGAYYKKHDDSISNSTMQRVMALLKFCESSTNNDCFTNFATGFAAEICKIRQSKQKFAAAAFVSGKKGKVRDQIYFKEIMESRLPEHIRDLIFELGIEDIKAYVKYLTVASTRVKQLRQADDRKKAREAASDNN